MTVLARKHPQFIHRSFILLFASTTQQLVYPRFSYQVNKNQSIIWYSYKHINVRECNKYMMNDLPFPLHSARPGRRQTQGRTTPGLALLVALRVPTTDLAHHTAHHTHVTPAKTTNYQLLTSTWLEMYILSEGAQCTLWSMNDRNEEK